MVENESHPNIIFQRNNGFDSAYFLSEKRMVDGHRFYQATNPKGFGMNDKYIVIHRRCNGWVENES
ncbi:MAG: hypothetical protein FWG98_13330 [Candidatus Cloacimonetes bacterium]|nr:hypothetical protein [Candidatus Cloacimonadota bacterium]